ncbi:MAG TPA: choice-of-anchor H family protein [Woeseiaceae bacterium]|nr:choice-of-anchor H family protein [Woeseiaceae bacterium]
MFTAQLDRKPAIALLTAAAILVAISATSAAAVAGDDADRRITLSTHSQGDGRESAVALKESRDEYEALGTSARSRDKDRLRASSKASSVQSASANADFWFYVADIELYGDSDRDGYYSGIDLLFDVDTYYSVAEIYAVAYLSHEGGPWEEYAVTEDFTIFGSSGTDDYVIVTDLVSGYPRGDYDILIEVFDADTSEFLAWFGPEDTSELAFLPLEDMERDTPPPETRVTVNSGGGGASDLLLLVLLGCSAAATGRRCLRKA